MYIHILFYAKFLIFLSPFKGPMASVALVCLNFMTHDVKFPILSFAPCKGVYVSGQWCDLELFRSNINSTFLLSNFIFDSFH